MKLLEGRGHRATNNQIWSDPLVWKRRYFFEDELDRIGWETRVLALMLMVMMINDRAMLLQLY